MCWTVPWVSTSTKNLAKSSVLQKLKGWPQNLQNCFSRRKGQHPREVFFLFLGRYSGSAYLFVHDESWWEVADTCLPLPCRIRASPLSLWSLSFHFDYICNCICLDIVLHSYWSSLWLQWEHQYCGWICEKASYYVRKNGLFHCSIWWSSCVISKWPKFSWAPTDIKRQQSDGGQLNVFWNAGFCCVHSAQKAKSPCSVR